MAGVTWEGGLVVLLFVLFGASRRPAFLRFRPNDVLLGTLGAGVHICGVSSSYFY